MGAEDKTEPFPLIDETLYATSRYLDALTVLDEAALAQPSALPGWTRAHVVAHLARNADAFSRVLAQVAAGEPASMYESVTARDHDIDETVLSHDLPALLEDSRASARRLAEALTTYRGPRDASYTRTPEDGASFPLETVVPRRRTEVEVHHADLLLDYHCAGWPEDFSRELVSRRQEELRGSGPSMVLISTDVDGVWKVGPDGPGPEVSGTVGELAWWLVGRGGGGLVSSTGELPIIPRWR